MTWTLRLKSHIKARGLTQLEFAKLVKVDDGVLNLYLNGGRIPKADFFERLRFSGVSLDWLFTGEGSPDADLDAVREPPSPYNADDVAALLNTIDELLKRLRPDK